MKTKMMMFAAVAMSMGSAASAQMMWNNGSWSPTPVTSAYPACSGAESDDRCIQLYERGVRTSANLAMNRDMNGTATAAMDDSMTMPADGSGTYTGQGGPYEPVDASGYAAMSGMATPTSRSGYPPCPRSDAADSCIQLYERGVTGNGN
ncbi:hypothetical protein IC614_04090 [Allosphingosinicella flava]|uniref:Uncharacterized protein n=1 Tax=Allosphingosinicella flava TaxID=2771430 RepID=A0A7T2LMY2_9SPHN|nr:hypothetical protein [Sphingosinicella flava]QPQ55778.1 hypothetical protein IC614_04090 [Sphingosinicella flava]